MNTLQAAAARAVRESAVFAARQFQHESECNENAANDTRAIADMLDRDQYPDTREHSHAIATLTRTIAEHVDRIAVEMSAISALYAAINDAMSGDPS